MVLVPDTMEVGLVFLKRKAWPHTNDHELQSNISHTIRMDVIYHKTLCCYLPNTESIE